MIKLIFNRFAGEVMEQTAKYRIIAEAEAKGTAKTASDINEVKKAITEVSTTPLTISTKDVDSSINKINEIKILISKLKNTKVDFSGSLSGLRESGLLDALPSGIKDSVDQLANLQNIVSDPAKFNAVVKDLDSLNSGLHDISKNSESAANGQRRLKLVLDAMKDPLKNLTKLIKHLDYTRLVNMWRTIRRISTGLVGIIENAAGYEESLNLYKMALGKYEDEGTKWADNISEKLMLDESDIMQYTGAFFNLAKGMGVSGDAAFKMSKNLTQLTYDMSSYLNISVEAAQAKIQSTMAGQSRAVASVGVATQMASLQELAYSLNIKKSVKDMTQREKTYLRYIQLMRQTQQMQGDLGRTMITPANAIRILKNQVNLLARSIGQVLVPILMEVIPVVIAFTNVLINLINTFSKYKVADVKYDNISFSFEDAVDGADNLDKLGESAKKAGKSVNESLAPFDELNNVISESSTAGSGSGIGGSIDSSMWDGLLPEYDMLKDFTDDLNKKAKDLEKTVGVIAGILGTIFAITTITGWIIKFAELIKAVKTIKTNWEDVKKVLSFFNPMSKTWGGTLSTILISTGLIVADFALISQGIKNAGDESKSLQSNLDIVGSQLSGIAAGALIGGKLGGVEGAAIGGLIGEVASVTVTMVESIAKIRELNDLAAIGMGQFNHDWTEAGRLVQEFNTQYANTMSNIYQTSEKELQSIKNAEAYKTRLFEIIDSQGKVKNGHEAEAKVLVEKLNKELGINIELRNGEIKGIDKVGKAIDKLIEKKKAEIKLTAMEKAYTTAIEQSQDAVDALSAAEGRLEAAKDLVAKASGKSKKAQEQANDKLKEAQTEYDNAMKHYQEMISNKERWELAYEAFLGGHYDRVNEIYDNSAKEQWETYKTGMLRMTNDLNGGPLSSEVEYAWKILAVNSSDDFNDAIKQVGNEDTRKQIIASIQQLGLPMTTEGELLGSKYTGSFVSSSQSYLNNNTLYPSFGLRYGTTDSLYNQLNSGITSRTITPLFSLGNTGSTLRNGLVNYFNKNPLQLNWKSEKSEQGGSMCVLRAGGGYVNSGDLFFANENGMPEYITSIGGKSAVVNQQQMVQSLTNAITAGFQQFGGNQPNNVVVYVGDKKLYEGQGEYQNRQNDRYGTTVVKI